MSISTTEFYFYTLSDENMEHTYASPLSKEATAEKGLPSEAIIGEFSKGKEAASVETFIPNATFAKFLFWALSKHIRDCPEFIAEAEKQGDGHIQIADLRGVTAEGKIELEDTIAIIEIKDGKAKNFNVNQQYIPFTHKGFMKLDPWLNEKYMEELTNLLKSR